MPRQASAPPLVPIARLLAVGVHQDLRQTAPDEEVPNAAACSKTAYPSAREARPVLPTPPTRPAGLAIPAHDLCSSRSRLAQAQRPPANSAVPATDSGEPQQRSWLVRCVSHGQRCSSQALVPVLFSPGRRAELVVEYLASGLAGAAPLDHSALAL